MAINRVLPDPTDVNFASLGFYSGEPAAWATAQNALTDDQSGNDGQIDPTGSQQQTDLNTEKTYLTTVVAGYIALGYVPVLMGASWLGVAQNRLNFLIQQAASHPA